MSIEYQTEIGVIREGEYHLRQQPITRLIHEHDLVASMWLTWTGKRLSSAEHALISGCLIACLDHGTAPPSAQVARMTASCGKPVADSVASGLLTLGARHGNAGAAASLWLRAHRSDILSDLVDEVIAKRERVPGFGHMEYEVDPRALALRDLAKDSLVHTPYVDMAFEVARLLTEKKGKPLPLNVDGVMGAIIADLDAPAELTDVIFLVARTVGLTAHALEEAAQSITYRRG